MVEVKEITIEEFEEKIYDKYITLFSKEELRDWDTIKEIYNKKYEHFYKIMDDDTIIGFFILEKIGDYPYYLDYFAIYNEYQSKGYGSLSIKKLLEDVIKDDGLIGEVEEVTEDDPITVRRWKFYEKLGFKKFDDVKFSYTVLFDLIIYPYNYNLTGLKVAEILYDYYRINIGEEETKRLCNIINKAK